MDIKSQYLDLKKFLKKVLKDDPDLLKLAEPVWKQISSSSFLSRLNDIGKQTDDWINAMSCALPLEKMLGIVPVLNEIITCRIIETLEKKIADSINLPAPVAYCWINMGSDARNEQIKRTDQDNALIFAQPQPGIQTRTQLFFEVLAGQVTDALAQFGFKKCPGNVMASNITWRRSENQWMRTLDRWIGSSNPEDIRKLTIFLDFKAVYGDKKIADRIHKKVFDLFNSCPQTNYYLLRDDKGLKLAEKINKKNHSGPFNVKTGGLVHLVNYIRLLAVNHQITSPSTINRLDALKKKGCIHEKAFEKYRFAFLFLMQLRFMALTGSSISHDKSANSIDIKRLTGQQLDDLNRALGHINDLHQYIKNKYDTVWMNYFS